MEFLSWNLAYVSELFEADGEDTIGLNAYSCLTSITDFQSAKP